MPDIMAPKFVDSPKDLLPNNKKRLIVLLFILIALPVTVILALTQQTFVNRASGPSMARVEVSPGALSTNLDNYTDLIVLSALAYDISNKPITSGIVYDWSMSSINSVGTISTDNKEIAEFHPLNYGCGQITVTARAGADSVTKSISVSVGEGANIPDCGTGDTLITASPSPTGIVTPEPTPIVVRDQYVTITNYKTNINLALGEKAKLMTVVSKYDQGVDLVGRPTNATYIWYSPNSLFMKAGIPQDVYIEAAGNEKVGIYSGEPEIKSVEYQAYSSKLPEITINLSEKSIDTPTPIVSVSPSTPTITNTPAPTINIPTLSPPTSTPAPQVLKVKYIAVADSFVRGGRASKNYGSKSFLATHNGNNMISYLKFDLRDLKDKKLKKATFRFKILAKLKSKWAPSNNNQTLSLVENSWTEKSITYNNRPVSGIPITTFKGDYYSRVIDLDVTDIVDQKKGGYISYSINSDGNDLMSFYSRESNNTKPQLIIEYY